MKTKSMIDKYLERPETLHFSFKQICSVLQFK